MWSEEYGVLSVECGAEPSDGKSSDPSVGSVGSAGGAAVAGAVIGTHCSTGGITGDVDDSHSGCGSKGFEANIGNGNVSIAWEVT